VYAVAASPRRSILERTVSKFGSALLLALLSILGLVFSLAMFVVVVVGMALTVGLLPVACAGLVVLVVLVWFIKPLAAIDAWLFQMRQRAYDELLRDD
ncbi:hypothetical protein As57867_013777, partial [Aphanomyces stellatus]